MMPFQICRICYTRGNTLLQLDDSNNYIQKLSSCIPEIDIYIINDPAICQKCAYKLDIAFELRNLCLENEKRYNSTFKERGEDSTSSNQNAVNCNEDFTESDAFEIDESNDYQNLLDVIDIKPEVAIFCSLCDKEFSSNHDKKLHDFKMHRQLQHRNLKSLLSPIHRNSDNHQLVLQNVIDNTVESSFNNNNNSFDSNTNENQDSVMLLCNECNMKFTDNRELESHKSTHLRKSCHVCMKTCDNENELGEHLKLHLVKCCGESYSTFTLLQFHTYNKHKMTCGICNKKFTDYAMLFDHLSEHTKETLYSCEICVEQFNTIEALNEHNCRGSYTLHEADDDHLEMHNDIEVESTISTVRRKQPIEYKCRKCNIGFSNRSLLVKHIYGVHTFGRCSKKKDHLEMHNGIEVESTISTVRRKRSIEYKCRKCNIGFSTRSLLGKHMYGVHTFRRWSKKKDPLEMHNDIEGESTISTVRRKRPIEYKCRKCNIGFSTRSLLVKHMYGVHTFGRPIEYKCRKCNVGFSTRSLLVKHIYGAHTFGRCSKKKDHLEMHNGIEVESTISTVRRKRPIEYKCRKCNVGFSTRSLLLKHIYGVHTFGRWSKKKDHLEMHNDIEVESTISTVRRKRPIEYKCRKCNIGFSTRSLLLKHIYGVHTFGRPIEYKCRKCNVGFSNRSLLGKHMHGAHTFGRWLKKNDHLEMHNDTEVESTISTVRSKRPMKYKCRKCNVGFSTRSLQVRHNYSLHTFGRWSKKNPDSPDLEKNVLTCYLCDRQFEVHVHLKMHILQFHCDKIPTVPIVDCCKDNFYKEQEGLRINFNIPPEYLPETNEIDIQRKKYIARSKCICFICRVLFKKVSTLYHHGKSKHAMCCNENIATVNVFLQHNLKHYDKAEKDGVHRDILCSMCKMNHKNYMFLLAHNCRTKLTKTEIRMNRKKMWSDRKESAKGSRCTIEIHKGDSSDESRQQQGNNSSGESRQQQSNNSSSNRSSCEICNKQFDCKTRLMDHIKTHI